MGPKAFINSFFLNIVNHRAIQILILPVIMLSCSAPVNLAYDNAYTIEKEQFEVQASYSDYYNNSPLTDWSTNYGMRLTHGLISRHSEELMYLK